MTFTQKILLMFAGILTPLMLLAADVPANVKQIEAKVVNGEFTVTWEAAGPVAGIDFYRVYFSHKSILQNDGNYDDFERTASTDTTYTFKTLPLKSGKIFVSVLAVNKAGVESEGFEAEASVDVPVIPVSSASSFSQSSVSSSKDATTAVPMTLVNASAASETGIVIVFSKSVSLSVAIQPSSFLITDGSGTQLSTTALEINDATILLHTGTQTLGKVYFLRLVQPIAAADGTNASTSVAPVQVIGFGQAEGVSSRFSSVASSQSSNDSSKSSLPYGKNPALVGAPTRDTPSVVPTDLKLTPMLRKDGTYDVRARWMHGPDADHSLMTYTLSTSTDGQHFIGDSAVSRNQTTASYNKIPAGLFGVRIAAKTNNGHDLDSIQKVINLPESGIGVIGITLVSGGIAALRRRRRTVIR